ncbi:MAG: hypothetical protein HXY34_09225 [Candidatus Thorarchaeota archaeon]|nr:hypothetical protein [Candidatus Thorarchaeota archaeon]
MSDDKKARSVVDEKERIRLIQEIGKIKETLDSFKYGLNFEEFADEIFKTIDRQTISMKKLQESMDSILERLKRLEAHLDEGIKVRLRGQLTSDAAGSAAEEIVIEPQAEPVKEAAKEDTVGSERRAALEAEASELRVKIARLFEKENEFIEMQLNDPASAAEYDEKSKVTRTMRRELERQLRDIEAELGK